MPAYFTIAFHLPESDVAPEHFIKLVDKCLLESSSQIEFGGEYILSDPELDYNFDFIETDSIDEAAIKLSEWKCFGAVSYVYEESEIYVNYLSLTGSKSIRGITISIGDYILSNSGPKERVSSLVELIKEMHRKVLSLRTIMSWQIEGLGYEFEDQISDLENGNIKGIYWLDILRSDYAGCAHLDILRKNVFDGGVIEYDGCGK